MDIADQARFERLEKEVAALKAQIQILESCLMKAESLPILGPGLPWDNYARALKQALAKPSHS